MAAVDLQLNALLGMLPPPVTQRIERDLTVVFTSPGDVLLDPGEAIESVYFPLDLVASLDQVVGEGVAGPAAPSVALAGREGVIGIEAFLGADSAIGRSTVRVGGQAVRVGTEALREEFARAGAFHRLLLRLADALVTQIAATSACERVHSVQQRLTRWLLLCDDRAPLRDLGLTQESLSQMLGVRRASISAAASLLQKEGWIAYRRGLLMVVDRSGLEAQACNCYRDIKTRYTNYLSPD